jgi:cell division protein FtsB
MNYDIIITALLSVIGFFLAAIFFYLQKVSRNVESLMINEAAHKEQLQDLERRINQIESQNNGLLYGKR